MKIGCLGRGEGKRGQWSRPVKKFDYNISSKIEEPIKIDLRKESSVAGGFCFPLVPMAASDTGTTVCCADEEPRPETKSIAVSHQKMSCWNRILNPDPKQVFSTQIRSI